MISSGWKDYDGGMTCIAKVGEGKPDDTTTKPSRCTSGRLLSFPYHFLDYDTAEYHSAISFLIFGHLGCPLTQIQKSQFQCEAGRMLQSF